VPEAPDAAGRRSSEEDERDLYREIESIPPANSDPTSVHGQRSGVNVIKRFFFVHDSSTK